MIGEMDSQYDQLSCIISSRVFNKDKDFSFISTKNTETYVNNISSIAQGEQNILEIIGDSDPQLQNLCLKMLEFNPYFRWTAQECIESPYFDDVRTPLPEKKSKGKINLDLEDLSIEELHLMIYTEAQKYQ